MRTFRDFKETIEGIVKNTGQQEVIFSTLTSRSLISTFSKRPSSPMDSFIEMLTTRKCNFVKVKFGHEITNRPWSNFCWDIANNPFLSNSLFSRPMINNRIRCCFIVNPKQLAWIRHFLAHFLGDFLESTWCKSREIWDSESSKTLWIDDRGYKYPWLTMFWLLGMTSQC